MLKIVLCLFILTSSFAQEIGGDIGSILKYMEEFEISTPEEIIDKKESLNEIDKLPSELNFLKGHLAFSQYEIEEYDEETAKRRAKILFETLDPNTFEFLYIGFQEICDFYMSDEEPEKCENLYEWFYGVNDEYQTLLETGYAPGGKIKDLVGDIGVDYGYSDHILSDETRSSYRLKNAALVKDQKNISDDESQYILCQFELLDQFEQEEDVMLGLADLLEGELIRGDTPLKTKAEIYCTLESYYQRIGNQDRWFLLIPRTPEGIDLSCSTN